MMRGTGLLPMCLIETRMGKMRDTEKKQEHTSFFLILLNRNQFSLPKPAAGPVFSVLLLIAF